MTRIALLSFLLKQEGGIGRRRGSMPYFSRAIEALPGDGYLGADRDAGEKIGNVGIVHANAAFRNRLANCPGRVSAVDTVQARAEVEGMGTKRVLGVPAGHVSG